MFVVAFTLFVSSEMKALREVNNNFGTGHEYNS